eukprot:COSAG02_NODE_2068_length_9943_cov_5.977245_5_plen_133_part_00
MPDGRRCAFLCLSVDNARLCGESQRRCLCPLQPAVAPRQKMPFLDKDVSCRRLRASSSQQRGTARYGRAVHGADLARGKIQRQCGRVGRECVSVRVYVRGEISSLSAGLLGAVALCKLVNLGFRALQLEVNC